MSTTEATSTVRSLQGRSAAARRWNLPNQNELARDYAAARIADYIERVVAEAPPLTAEQRDRLAVLLKGGGASPPPRERDTGRPATNEVRTPSRNLPANGEIAESDDARGLGGDAA